ncbi:hypothetical protein N7520_003324 [Penicillium odoratum]|uniref:uncharacterized protein n=1 Tax=Penicillium odoratum TaxID=1167516 RepID=UPI002547E4DE|nr:uncharacterized protein N7520_003324 [Penicillium odoratum]KAJ5768765.1 hypothetical protein N7520_003324 [Penicillium odoratum]
MNHPIESELQAQIRYKKPGDPEPDAERLVKETHKDTIFSDKQFWDGASVKQVRQHFFKHLCASKGQGTGRFKGCLLIDKRSVKSIIASPDPQPWLGRRRSKKPSYPWGFVGMIDGRYPENGSSAPRFLMD